MKRPNTIQRDLVLDAVKTLGNHATAEEIYEWVKSNYPNIGKGTVYRNLNLLAESGHIKRVSVLGGADHFDHNIHDHYHVKCVNCNRVFDVEMDMVDNLIDTIKDTHGILFLDYEIAFNGVCVDCQKS